MLDKRERCGMPAVFTPSFVAGKPCSGWFVCNDGRGILVMDRL